MTTRFKQIYPNLKLKEFLDLLYIEDLIQSSCKQLEFDTKFFKIRFLDKLTHKEE